MPDKEFALRPCPFCGDNEAPLVVVRRGKDGWRDRFLVLCDYEHGGCGGSSGWYHYEPEAVGAWNRRATAADVEPKQRWIPVTERLPETNEKVLVYVFDPDFCGPYIEFGHWLNWLKRWGEFDDEVGDFGDCTIIAWMPLPEPPKEDGE